MSHTPGPWNFYVGDDGPIAIVSGEAQPGHRRVITRLDGPSSLPKDERTANALLMKAAPDLLKELKFLHRAYCFAVGAESRQHQVALDALDAIAKAEGQL